MTSFLLQAFLLGGAAVLAVLLVLGLGPLAAPIIVAAVVYGVYRYVQYRRDEAWRAARRRR